VSLCRRYQTVFKGDFRPLSQTGELGSRSVRCEMRFEMGMSLHRRKRVFCNRLLPSLARVMT